MWEFLSNNWFVSIIGGLISGVIVYVVTNMVKKYKDRKDYIEKVKIANNEVLKLFTDELSAGSENINISLMSVVIESVALKHEVYPKDMFSVAEICQLLIYQVMDTSFISHDLKTYYYKIINEIIIDFELSKDQKVKNENNDNNDNNENNDNNDKEYTTNNTLMILDEDNVSRKISEKYSKTDSLKKKSRAILAFFSALFSLLITLVSMYFSISDFSIIGVKTLLIAMMLVIVGLLIILFVLVVTKNKNWL